MVGSIKYCHVLLEILPGYYSSQCNVWNVPKIQNKNTFQAFRAFLELSANYCGMSNIMYLIVHDIQMQIIFHLIRVQEYNR